MARPPLYITVGLKELVKLVFFYMSCVKQENVVGECSIEEPLEQLLNNLEAQNQIKVTPKQLDSLVYHYKQAVMCGLNPAMTLDLSEKEYQSLMRQLQHHAPDFVKENKFGELVLKGFR